MMHCGRSDQCLISGRVKMILMRCACVWSLCVHVPLMFCRGKNGLQRAIEGACTQLDSLVMSSPKMKSTKMCEISKVQNVLIAGLLRNLQVFSSSYKCALWGHHCPPYLCLITARTYLSAASCDCVKKPGAFSPQRHRDKRRKNESRCLWQWLGCWIAEAHGRFCCYKDWTNKVSAIQEQPRFKRVRPG